MKRIFTGAASFVFFLALVPGYSSAGEMAGPECVSKDTSAWLTKDTVIEKAAEIGLELNSLSVSDGNCYAATTTDESGEDVELYFDPMTGVLLEDIKPLE